MALENAGVSADEVQSGWNRMCVGPILDRDMPSRPEDSSLCRVAQTIFLGPITPSQGLEQGARATSLITSSAPQDSSSRCEQSVRSSPFYFGSATAVIERDEKSSSYFVRLQNAVTEGIDWVKLESGKLYM